MGTKDVEPEHNTGMPSKLDDDEVRATHAPITMSKALKGAKLFWKTGTTWLRKERTTRRR